MKLILYAAFLLFPLEYPILACINGVVFPIEIVQRRGVFSHGLQSAVQQHRIRIVCRNGTVTVYVHAFDLPIAQRAVRQDRIDVTDAGTGVKDQEQVGAVVVTFSVVVFTEAAAVVPVGIGMVFHSVVLLSVVVVGSVVGTVIYGGRVTVVTGVVFVVASAVATILLVLLLVVCSTIVVVVLAVVVEAGVSSGSA